MRLQDLNWKDVESYLQRDNRIILVTGATEQHAYLSLLTDILIPSRVADAVAEREGVLVAPPLNFGVSQHFAEFPGTISITQETFDIVLSEIVESLLHQGFGKFFILNGHGGNKIPLRLEDLHLEGAIQLKWYDWWRENAVKQFEAEIGLTLDHANWGENFPFNRVAEMPQALRESYKPRVNLELQNDGKSMRDILGDGSYGGLYQADDGVMGALFNRVVDEVAGLLRELNA